MHVFFLMVFIEAASCDCHARTNQLPHRSTIVHLFEWKWQDIADECERFLGPNGFGAVQVSPPSENLIMRLKHLKNTRPWYERYRPISYKINTRSGNEEDFADMVTRCNKAGVRIYADVVLNHMAGDYNDNVGTAGSTADFEKYEYPAVPYTREHFHEPCTINYNIAKQVRECQLDGTQDLNHRLEHVRERIVDYLKKLLAMGVAGFRIDSAKHIWPEDLREIYSQLYNFEDKKHFSSSKPYIYHEITFNATGEATKPFEYTGFGDVADYRVGQELKNLFRGLDPLKLLKNWGQDWGLLPSEKAVVSIDNHESQREDDVITYKEAKAYKAAVAFILAHPYGEPRVMSSYYFDKWEQGPPSDQDGNILSPSTAGPNQSQKNEACGNGWVCEHRWRQIYQMVAFRNAVSGTDVIHWWDNGKNLIAFSRGDKGFIAFNLEDGKDMNATIRTALPPGDYCDVISGERDNNQCTGRKVSVTEQQEGRRLINIRIPAYDEDTHIAIHVGPESSLQTDWTPGETGGRPPTLNQPTVDDGHVSWQTTRRWNRERDPLPPLTSEPPRTVSCVKQKETSGQSGHQWYREILSLTSEPARIVPSKIQEKERWQTSQEHLWHQERDLLPVLPFVPTSSASSIKEGEKERQIGQRWHQEHDALLSSTSEPARIIPCKKQEKERWKTRQKHRWYRERDPLPPLMSEPASIETSTKQKKEGRKSDYRWYQERDSIPYFTSEPVRILSSKKYQENDRQTFQEHHWYREFDPLPPLTSSEPARIVIWIKENKEGRQTGRRWYRENDLLPPLTSESAEIVTWKKQEKEGRQNGHRWHRENDLLPPLTAKPARIVPWKKQVKEGRQTSQEDRWHRERDPLPSFTSETASIVAWRKLDKEGRQTFQEPRWHRDHDPLPPLTSEPARIIHWIKQEKEGRQTGHRWYREQDLLSPLTSERTRIVPWKVQEKDDWYTSQEHRWHRERDPLPPLTSEPAWASVTSKNHRPIIHHHRDRGRYSLSHLKSEPESIVAWKKQKKKCKQIHLQRDPLPPLLIDAGN